MTFLFTDIEGSTRRWEESSSMGELVDRHFGVLRSVITAAGGEVFATMGDGIAAAFTAAGPAVDAAVQAQRELRELGLEVRMGIHAGEVERFGDDYRGRSVNRAARVMALGHGGQLLLSDVAAALVRSGGRPGVEVIDLGTHRLRGIAEPERLWQVVHPDLRRSFPALRSADTGAPTLPAERSSLVGRDADAERIATLFERERVITLTGVGGVGKTRLAVRVATDLVDAFPALWYVPLASISDPDDVADAVALAVGAGGAAGPITTAIRDAIAGGPALLVLDNCEHVIDAASALVDELASTCPDLRVLATSREALGVAGEQVVGVRPLDVATAAVELFRQRATAAGAEVAGRAALIEALCGRLDGIPLAIELAAARTATLGIAAVGEALDDLTVLHPIRRGTEERHSTMRATIEWSYRLLEADEQRLFRWLGVFVGGFELDAVQHVGEQLGIGPLATRAHIESLVHKSMISADPTADGVRFTMLETMRAFAADQLDVAGERLAARRALATWMTTIAGMTPEDPCSPEVERCSVRLEREADNWREAMLVAAQVGDGQLAAGLCGPPANFFLLGRHDLADVVRPLVACCVTPQQRRAVLCALIVSASGATQPEQLLAWTDEVVAIDEIDPTGIGGLMQWLAVAWRGDFRTGVRVCVRAAQDRRLRRTTRDLFVGIAILDHFSLTDMEDDHDALVPLALEVAARSEMALTRVSCLLGVAWALAERDPSRSVRLVREALDDIPRVPALTRLTLPGSASRLLSRLDPQVAAEALLEQLTTMPRRQSYVDMIPLFYGAALLERLGRGMDVPTLATVAGHRPVRPGSMMDFVDQARSASVHGDALSLHRLEATVRAGLAEVAGLDDRRALERAGA